MSDIASAIRIIQEATGCRVLLEPMTAKNGSEAIAKTMESSRTPAKRVTKKHVTKAEKKVTEPPKTFVSVPQFAQLTNRSVAAIYHAVKPGKKLEKYADKSGKNIKIDTAAVALIDDANNKVVSVRISDPAPAKKQAKRGNSVRCVELDKVFDSFCAAARAFNVADVTIGKAVRTGCLAAGYHFERV